MAATCHRDAQRGHERLPKARRAIEVFSVTGLPDAVATETGKKNRDGAPLLPVELRGWTLTTTA